MRGEECQKHEEKNVKGFHRLGLSFRKRFRAQARRGDRHACVVFGRPPAKILSLQTGDQWSPLRSRGTEIVDYTATLFRSISLKPCRGRRPRRPEKQQILLFMWLPIIAGCKLKILSFPDRRKAIAAGPYRQKFKLHRYAATPSSTNIGEQMG